MFKSTPLSLPDGVTLTVNRSTRDRLARMVPRPLLVLVAEIGGVCPVQLDDAGLRGKVGRRFAAKWAWRLRLLADRDDRTSPHPLFDPNFYLENNPDVRDSRWSPLLHFLLWGGFEGRRPHPLFDPAWYMAQYSDVAACGLNPLQHYIRFGWREGRNPHPLFDTAWYLHKYPDVKAAGCDPMAHFLEWGAAEGRQPHPLFDSEWYFRRYPDARQSGLNPLVHYVLHGGARGLDPNRGFNAAHYSEQYPASVAQGLNPLIHYVTGLERGAYDPHPGFPRPGRGPTQPRPSVASALRLAPGKSIRKAPRVWQNSFTGSNLPVFVVYGSSNLPFVEGELIPALAAQHCRTRMRLHLVNYRHSRVLLSPSARAFSERALAGVTDWSAEREDRHIGFGEAVNYLFSRVSPESCFLLVNPDAMPMAGCIDRLLETFCERSAALVEARQWPSEHPKEYDPATGWTPWASGAFVLIASRAFRQLNGFDPLYFLYNEDVDLCWRAWLQDMPVIYEPRAICAHFTGLLSYGPTRFYYEHFFSIRNFLVIAYKFFGDAGECAAWRWIEEARLPEAFRAKVEESYLRVRGNIQPIEVPDTFYADNIKILGLNLYHQLRQV